MTEQHIADEGARRQDKVHEPLGDYLARRTAEAATGSKFPSQAPQRASTVAVAFLKQLDPIGAHALTWFDPATGKPVENRTFPPGDWVEMAKCIDERDGRLNQYYMLNEPRADAPHVRLNWSHVAAVRAVGADKDLKGDNHDASRAALDAELLASLGGMEPTFTVDSGGGLQPIFRLTEKLDPIEFRAQVEAQGRGLAKALGGDAVQDIARILRLPGTKNIPGPAKQAKGRVERRSGILRQSGKAYTLEALAAKFPPKVAPEHTDNDAAIQATAASLDMGLIQEAVNYSDLPEDLRIRFERACARDPKLKALWGGHLDHEDQSASQYRFMLARSLGRHGFMAQEFGMLVWVWDYNVKAEDVDRMDEKLSKRALARDWTNATKADADFVAKHWQPVAKIDAGAEWPEPLDLFADADPGQLAEPPEGSLPGIVERWALTESRRKGSPKSFAAAAAIAVAGAAIGGSLRIRVKQFDDGFSQPASLWVVLVAPPGCGKSPIIKAAVQPLLELDKERWAQDQPIHDRWMKASRTRGKQAPDPGLEPRVRRCAVDDATMEKLIRIMKDNPRGVLSTPDELVGLLGKLGAYKASAEGDRGQLLRMFDGQSIIVDRVGGGTLRAETALLGILAGSQPEKMRQLAKDLGGDGLLQRFFPIISETFDRDEIDEVPDHGALTDYAHAIRYFAQAEHGVAGRNITMSAGAMAVVKTARADFKRMKHIPLSPAWAGHVDKWTGFLARVVLIFHAFDHFEVIDGIAPNTQVEESTAAKAVAFAEFLLRHSLRFYETYLGTGEDAGDARWLGGYLLTHPDLKHFGRREVYNAKTELRADKRRLQRAVEELECAGWCRPMPGERDVLGATRWEVNPLIHARFEAAAQREREQRNRRREQIVAAGAVRRRIVSDLSSGPGKSA